MKSSMSNKSCQDPLTIDDLLEEQKIQNKLSISNGCTPNNMNSVEELQHVINLFTAFPDYYLFLINSNRFDYYELPYLVFGDIIDYINRLYLDKKNDDIRRILLYVDQQLIFFSQTHNQYGIGLIRIGILEQFDRLNCLSDILPLMPNLLRKDFIESFPQYLQQ